MPVQDTNASKPHMHIPHLVARPVLAVDRLEPRHLVVSELVQALVVAVVHEVVDRVQSRLVGASIGLRRAAIRGSPLSWCVGDEVTVTLAAGALEDVEETEPVSDFVDSCDTEIVVGRSLHAVSIHV